MKEAQYLIRVCHGTHPSIPGGILQAVSKAGDGKDYDQYGIWGMDSDDDVG